MAFYPSSLPPPQQRGFNYKIKPNIIRTQMADGHVRQRLVNTGAPDELGVSFVFSQSQYQEFMKWYRADIHYGQDWFYMPVLNDSDSGYAKCRIQKGELSVNLNCVRAEGPLWSVQCRLDVGPVISTDEVWIEPDGWKELYAFIWAPYTVTAEWPGLKLKKNRFGYYVLSVDMLKNCFTDCTIEFNDNDGKQTGGIWLYEFENWRGCTVRLTEWCYEAEIISWEHYDALFT